MKIGRIHYIRVAVQVICQVGPTNSPLLIRNKMEKVHKKRRLSVKDGARLRMSTIAAFDVIRYLFSTPPPVPEAPPMPEELPLPEEPPGVPPMVPGSDLFRNVQCSFFFCFSYTT